MFDSGISGYKLDGWELVVGEDDEGDDGEIVFYESNIDFEEEGSVGRSTLSCIRYGFNGWVYQAGDVSGRQIAFQNYIEEIELGLTFLESLLQKKQMNEGDKESPINVQFLDRSDITLEKVRTYRDFLFLLSQNRNIPVKVGRLYEDIDENIRKPLRDVLRKVNAAFVLHEIDNNAVSSVFALLNEANWKTQSKKNKNLVKGGLSSNELLVPKVPLGKALLQLKPSSVNDGQRFLNSVRPFDPNTLRILLQSYLRDQLDKAYLSFLNAYENSFLTWFQAIEERIKKDVIARLSRREKPFEFDELLQIKHSFDAVMHEAISRKDVRSALMAASENRRSRTSLSNLPDLFESDSRQRKQIGQEGLFETPKISDQLAKIAKILEVGSDTNKEEKKREQAEEVQRRREELQVEREATRVFLEGLRDFRVDDKISEIDLSSYPLTPDEIEILSTYLNVRGRTITKLALNDCGLLEEQRDEGVDAFRSCARLVKLDLGNNPALGDVSRLFSSLEGKPIEELNLSGCSFNQEFLYDFLAKNKTCRILILRDVQGINPEKIRDAIFRSPTLKRVVLPRNTPLAIRNQIANLFLTRDLQAGFENGETSLEAFRNNLDCEHATTLSLNLTFVKDLQPVIDWLQWLNEDAVKKPTLRQLNLTGRVTPQVANQFADLLVQLPDLEGISFHTQFQRDSKGDARSTLGVCLETIGTQKSGLKQLSIQGRESFRLTATEMEQFVQPTVAQLEHLESLKLNDHGLGIGAFHGIAQNVPIVAPLKKFSFKGNRLNRRIHLFKQSVFCLVRPELAALDFRNCNLSDDHLLSCCSRCGQKKGQLININAGDNDLELNLRGFTSDDFERPVVVEVTGNRLVSEESWKTPAKQKGKIYFATAGLLDVTGSKKKRQLSQEVGEREQRERRLTQMLNDPGLRAGDLVSEAGDIAFGCQNAIFQIPHNQEKRTALYQLLSNSQTGWRKFVITIPAGLELNQFSDFCEALVKRMPGFYSLNRIDVKTHEGVSEELKKAMSDVLCGRFQKFAQEHTDFMDLNMSFDDERIHLNFHSEAIRESNERRATFRRKR